MEQDAESVNPFDDPDDVVMDVLQSALHFQVHVVFFRAAFQCLQHGPKRVCGALEFDDFPGELVDAPCHVRAGAEQLVLDLVDVILETGDYGLVLIHDFV